MLTTHSSDGFDIGKTYWPNLVIDTLVGKGIPDAPGERAEPPTFMPYSLVEDQSHRVVLLRSLPDLSQSRLLARQGCSQS
jgi:hypothetical protein